MRWEGGVVAQFQASFKQEESILAAPVRVGLDALPLGSHTQGVIITFLDFLPIQGHLKKNVKNTTFYLELAGATTYLLLPLCALERRHQNAPPQTLAGKYCTLPRRFLYLFFSLWHAFTTSFRFSTPSLSLAGAQEPPRSLLEERTCSQKVVPER